MRYLSVCSGIEAASIAWHPLGWKPLAFAEIEPFPRAVLAHRFPDVPLHGDFTVLRNEKWIVDADLLVGGTPCQGFSIAGLRGSLSDDRSNLALEFIRLADAIDDLRRASGREPAYITWENVPGVLNVPDNAFGTFLAGLCGCDAPLVSPNEYGWSDAGVVAGPKRVAAWRVLDAQYFGLAQRRRRVFVLARGGVGGWRCADALLPIVESMQRHSAPRREKGKRTAPTLAARTRGGGGLGTDFDFDGGLIAADVANTVTTDFRHANIDQGRGELVDHTITAARGSSCSHDPSMETFVPVVASTGGGVSHCLNAGGMGQLDYETETLVAHSCRGGDFDVPMPISGTLGSGGRTAGSATNQDAMNDLLLPVVFDETQITSSANYSQPQPGDPSHPLAAGARPPTIAFSAKDHGADALSDLSPTLRAGGFTKSHANAGVMPAIAYHADDYDAGTFSETDLAGPMTTSADRTRAAPIAVTRWRVRRLTPNECEALQGFPRNWTLIPGAAKGGWRDVDETEDVEELKALGLATKLQGNIWRVKDPDGPRYRALGNSFAVNVVRWMGRRIQIVEQTA